MRSRHSELGTRIAENSNFGWHAAVYRGDFGRTDAFACADLSNPRHRDRRLAPRVQRITEPDPPRPTEIDRRSNHRRRPVLLGRRDRAGDRRGRRRELVRLGPPRTRRPLRQQWRSGRAQRHRGLRRSRFDGRLVLLDLLGAVPGQSLRQPDVPAAARAAGLARRTAPRSPARSDEHRVRLRHSLRLRQRADADHHRRPDRRTVRGRRGGGLDGHPTLERRRPPSRTARSTRPSRWSRWASTTTRRN